MHIQIPIHRHIKQIHRSRVCIVSTLAYVESTILRSRAKKVAQYTLQEPFALVPEPMDGKLYRPDSSLSLDERGRKNSLIAVPLKLKDSRRRFSRKRS